VEGEINMLNMNNLKRQHEDIDVILTNILKEIKSNDIEKNAMEISKHISILSGKLRIHLNEEDKWLYPSMEKSENSKLQEFNRKYQDEMKGLFGVFMSYKDKFNTKTKILNDMEGFKKETEFVFTKLKERVDRENQELYPLL